MTCLPSVCVEDVLSQMEVLQPAVCCLVEVGS